MNKTKKIAIIICGFVLILMTLIIIILYECNNGLNKLSNLSKENQIPQLYSKKEYKQEQFVILPPTWEKKNEYLIDFSLTFVEKDNYKIDKTLFGILGSEKIIAGRNVWVVECQYGYKQDSMEPLISTIDNVIINCDPKSINQITLFVQHYPDVQFPEPEVLGIDIINRQSFGEALPPVSEDYETFTQKCNEELIEELINYKDVIKQKMLDFLHDAATGGLEICKQRTDASNYIKQNDKNF